VNKLFHRLTDWTHWPFLLFYAPLSIAWCWYSIKSRAFWFFTPSNPTITFGGFEGETKTELYDQLPQHLYPDSVLVQPTMLFAEVVQKVKLGQISYPCIVKPNAGMKGILFRKIENEQQLKMYHQQMPAEYLVQEFVSMPLEVSIFYCRMPGINKGTITAFIQKDLLEVTGDGMSTLQELIQQHTHAAAWINEIKQQQGYNLGKVLRAGERFYLSHVGNRLHGATFVNLSKHITQELVQLFDAISHENEFYYGRYDIKCAAITDIKAGKNFTILEFNGAGSIPNHIYTGGFTLLEAYKEVLLHWRWLYKISRTNYKKGIAYWSFWKGYRFLKKSKAHFRTLKKVDKALFMH
jgi:hypothetical protein